MDFLDRPDTAAMDTAIMGVMHPSTDLAADATDQRPAAIMAWRLFLVLTGWHQGSPTRLWLRGRTQSH